MHELEVNVRFSETDALGHINNTSYFVYLEEARMKFFEALGLATNVESWNFLLASTKCDFIAQGYFNQLLTIRTSLTKVGTKSCDMAGARRKSRGGGARRANGPRRPCPPSHGAARPPPAATHNAQRPRPAP